MCGLAVIYNTNGVPEHLMSRMLKDIGHRGPDACNQRIMLDGILSIGHVRLKVIDTTDSANQPISTPCGRYTLVYNGEIYNYRDIRDKLGDYWDWRTQSDTEVLLAAWSFWGEKCLHRLVGMFAFVVYDSELNTITVVRDRFGIKPLYYYSTRGQWAFTSEILPLFKIVDQVKANESTIRTYLESGLYNHTKNTFFHNIFSVASGSLIHIDLESGKWQDKVWYNILDHVPDLSCVSDAELIEGAEARIEQAIKSHLVADVEVGLNISGGVDSSMLARVALEQLGAAHLFNQNYEGYSELPWVKEVAGTGILHVANLGPDEIKEWLLPTVRSQTEPFGGVFVCGYNALYKLANKYGVTVLLDGNGVDEIFLGYQRYHQIYVHSATTEAVLARRADDYTQFWKIAPTRPVEGCAIDGTSGLRPKAITDSLLRVDPLPTLNLFEFDDPVRQAAAEDLLHTKIPRVLRFNDRLSMAHSCELRVPYLDHRLVEYAFGISSEKLFSSRGTKLIFRELLAKRAPKAIAYAAKRSVQSPQREWLASEWRPLVESVLSSDSFFDRGWVDRDRSLNAYRSYLDGDNANSFFIWQWVNLELWAREYLDGACRQ